MFLGVPIILRGMVHATENAPLVSIPIVSTIAGIGTDQIVISQIYGGGGTAGATYQNSFLEIFNRGTNTVDLNSWQFHFASSATGSFNATLSLFNISGAIPIQPGQHLLIQLESSGTGGTALPVSPDFTVHLPTPAFGLSGKIAITKPNTSLGVSPCPLPNSNVVDLVGFGSTANCFEGSGPAPILTNTTAAIRKANGCTDTDDNANDFSVSAPNPRNGSSPFNSCASLIQFSASGYSVDESGPDALVTVTRMGDTTSTSSVSFATSDTAGSQPCGMTNGIASSRCNYLSTIGTLTFAPGDTSKTVSIPIIDDSYADGNKAFTVTLSDPSGATLGSPATATITIINNRSSNGVNPNDTAGFFVRQHYVDFLNREPDTSGLNFWINEITSCGSTQSCIDVKRVNVSAAFYLSIEFQDTGYLVERIYKTAYGDAIGTSTFNGSHQLAVPIVRLNEFLADTQEIGGSVVVNSPGWETVLENNKRAYAQEFVQTPRFIAAFPTTMNDGEFLNKLNSNAGNPLSQQDIAQILRLGPPPRADMLRFVAEHDNLVKADFNRAFVLTQFFGYLRRNPNDLPDSDYTGYDFWLSKLNQFNGDYIKAEMVKAFISASEYRQRFGP
jgi:hypothetical protein